MADLLLNLNKNAERTLKERQKEYFDARHTDHLHKIRKLSKGSYAMSSKQLQKVKHVLEQDRNVHLNRGLLYITMSKTVQITCKTKCFKTIT